MRISVLSIHTSPVAQPGQGDAGGMNVYVDQSVRALAAAGHRVDVFTADPAPADAARLPENVRLHRLAVDAADKDELADAIDEIAALLIADEAFTSADLIWAHYWISAESALRAQELAEATGFAEAGRCGLAEADRSAEVRPGLVVSMHTIGAVKNRDSETNHERPQRLHAEERIAATADLLVANTPVERRDLIHELRADPGSVVVARPGVDHTLFTPGEKSDARAALGIDPDEHVVLYVGRMQFIKGTDVVVDTLSRMRENNPHLASRTRGILLGAASGGDTAPGNGTSAFMRALRSAIAAEPSIEVREPVPAHELAMYYRAADILLVPSRSESFGLVAAEAAATGLPAIAAAVGGLPDIVEHGRSGILISDHNPGHWALELERVLCDADLRRELSARATAGAARFDWSAMVERVLSAHADLRSCSPRCADLRLGVGSRTCIRSEVGPCTDPAQLVGRHG
ncbi:D-inositol-3-phosphate glycosyltransferase [Brevibacterium sanguinis]|uniref:D-inositol 3-phosphate glycosyltransferase n=2 Tax=Brevibacterium TaxID=1696 RepID=A0A366IJ97_9MICO|nr:MULTISPECIES: glycosyltransferase [Brevibacterium]RBP65587.1 D-inositol-3-phosphate glycosyltransferase [Brevibacterium sanguinis]RBP72221.1 D-inositol-3-phosphate glycosyltransferase [Brevibacterium celere]